LPAVFMCVLVASAPRCSGFTISHIDGIMGACPPSPTRGRSPSAEMRAAGISGVLGLLLRLGLQPLEAA
jgi:hypothetical protein